jgi:drug/metabolite transporter (DMT)-like permease
MLRAVLTGALAVLGVALASRGDAQTAMLVLLLAVACAFLGGNPVVGRLARRPERPVDARAVKQHRRAHPEASISDAITAVDRARE